MPLGTRPCTGGVFTDVSETDVSRRVDELHIVVAIGLSGTGKINCPFRGQASRQCSACRGSRR